MGEAPVSGFGNVPACRRRKDRDGSLVWATAAVNATTDFRSLRRLRKSTALPHKSVLTESRVQANLRHPRPAPGRRPGGSTQDGGLSHLAPALRASAGRRGGTVSQRKDAP